MKKLIIVAHPNYSTYSKITKGVIEGIKSKAKDTDVHILDEKGNFNIEEEQNRLLGYDVITFAFPTWWYQMPWNLKKWIDEVMTPGFAYSFQGDIEGFKLYGKKFSYMEFSGNIEEAYSEKGINRRSTEEFNMPLIMTLAMASKAYILKGNDYKIEEFLIKPIHAYGTMMGQTDENKISEMVNDYIKRIDSL